MAPPVRRPRSPSSLAAAVVDLLDEYEVPLHTRTVRVLLNDEGRRTTAEQLSRLAAYEREDFLRTRLPPRLCSVIDPAANLVSPRWWARGEWRLQRRILTRDATEKWLAVFAARLLEQLGSRTTPPSDALRTLALGAIPALLPERTDAVVPLCARDWLDLRADVVGRHPAATHTLEGPTSAQRKAEAALKEAQTAGVDLYFGRRH